MTSNLRDTVLSESPLRSIQNKSRVLINIVRAWISIGATDRKRAETFRRRYVEGVIAAQEAERKRISLDLHDSVSQLISCAKFKLQRIESRQIDRTGKLEAEIGNVLTLLEKANEEVRTIARNLRPTVLDDFGFEAAVRILCTDFNHRSNIPVNLDCDAIPQQLPSALEVNLYRILQEGLNNVEKHSNASSVRIAIRRDQTALVTTLQDDGIGFKAHHDDTFHMGLTGMKQRVSSLGGQMRIASSPNKGTEISLVVPIYNQGISDENQ